MEHQPHYFYFPIRELSSQARRAIKTINRLGNDHKKSFALSFDKDIPEKILVQSCKGRLKKTSFLLIERTQKIEDEVTSFNELLPKKPTILAVGLANEISITVVVRTD